MKRISTYLLILLFLAATVYFLVFKQQKASMNTAEMAFAVQDTASVTKIEILSQTKRTLTLEKKGAGQWRVNQFYKASPELVNSLLETMKQLSVKFPIGKGAYESVMREFDKPIKTVRIYTDSQPEVFKEYAIGSTTSTGNGVFMLLKGSEQPFVVNVKGLDGNVLPRFSNQLEAWRDRLLLNYTADDIAKIEASYELNPEHSFILSVGDNQTYSITSPSQKINSETQRLNKPLTATYLNLFKRLYSEAYENEYPKIDSIRKSKAFCRLKITAKNGKAKQLNIHHRDVNKRTKKQVDVNGVAMDYDSDRYFAFVEGQDDMFLIQEYVFGKVFKHFSDFYYEEVK